MKYHQRALMLAIGGFAIINLSACTPPVRIALPPVELTECADWPKSPDLPGRDQQAERDSLVMDYIGKAHLAHGDCKSKVAGLKVWRDSAK